MLELELSSVGQAIDKMKKLKSVSELSAVDQIIDHIGYIRVVSVFRRPQIIDQINVTYATVGTVFCRSDT